LNKEIKN